MNFAKKVARKLMGKDENTPTPAEAILRSKETEERLQRKQEHYEMMIEEQLAIAKKYARTNERVAKQALRKKHRYQEKLRRLDGTITTLEVQRQSIEDTTETVAVAETLSYGVKAMRKTLKKTDPDKIYDLFDDIAGQQELAKEAAGALSTSIYGQDIDEEALEMELQDLLLEDNYTVPSATIRLPPVPQFKLAARDVPSRPGTATKAEDQDEDLKKLEAWAWQSSS